VQAWHLEQRKTCQTKRLMLAASCDEWQMMQKLYNENDKKSNLNNLIENYDEEVKRPDIT